jgi:hypothetical protein
LGTLKATLDISRRAVEMEHLSPNRGFVRGAWRDGSYAKDFERHVMEGSGHEHFYKAPKGGT